MPRLSPPAVVALALALLPLGAANGGEVLERILTEKSMRLGVRTDAPPFAYEADGQLHGFSIDLCERIASAIVATSDITDLTGRLVRVDATDRFEALEEGRIDVLCGATTATLTRREGVSFTIPTFRTGAAALVLRPAPQAVRDALLPGDAALLGEPTLHLALAGRRVGVRAGTTTESWLRASELAEAGIDVAALGDHAEGVRRVANGSLAAYFADRAILLGLIAAMSHPELFAVSTPFTQDSYALAIPRGDEDFRLVLDRALSHIYARGTVLDLYARHFGDPGPDEARFYSLAALPE